MIGSSSVRPVVSTGGQLIGGFADKPVGEVVLLSDPAGLLCALNSHHRPGGLATNT